ncbi:MAG TPA: hypothetical protein DC006_07770, partial [Prevotellaceae bacterium]|nr:hypothetical protein [Prevotellaceae bacterium]
MGREDPLLSVAAWRRCVLGNLLSWPLHLGKPYNAGWFGLLFGKLLRKSAWSEYDTPVWGLALAVLFLGAEGFVFSRMSPP